MKPIPDVPWPLDLFNVPRKRLGEHDACNKKLALIRLPVRPSILKSAVPGADNVLPLYFVAHDRGCDEQP
jgi:hypothetical protein